MNEHMKVTAIVGSYRKGGIIDKAIDVILASASEEGAEVTKIYLIDKHIEFCTNCRACMQQERLSRGACVIADDMNTVLNEIERSDAIILASPMNLGTVTAVMKRFMERLVCYVYWPWGVNVPKVRNKQKQKRAIVVASSAAPALIARLSTQIVGQLKNASSLLGARPIGVLFVGLAAREQRQEIGERSRKIARCLGKKLVSNSR